MIVLFVCLFSLFLPVITVTYWKVVEISRKRSTIKNKKKMSKVNILFESTFTGIIVSVDRLI